MCQGCVRPIDAKVDAIDKFPTPVTRHELCRFLGMGGNYRGFCRNFATVVTPLFSQMKSFIWSKSSQACFDNAKALLRQR